MTRTHALIAALTAGLVATFGHVTDQANASYVPFQPDLRRCFCDALSRRDIEWIVMAQLLQRRETRPEGDVIASYLVVENRYGATAPPIGTEIPFRIGDEIPLRIGDEIGPERQVLVMRKRNPDELYVLGVETGKTLRFIGTPESGWGERYTYDEYCVERRDAHAVLSFVESVDFDPVRCLDRITEELGIPKPVPFVPEDPGCSSGRSTDAVWMAFLAWLLARRPRRNPSSGGSRLA